MTDSVLIIHIVCPCETQVPHKRLTCKLDGCGISAAVPEQPKDRCGGGGGGGSDFYLPLPKFKSPLVMCHCSKGILYGVQKLGGGGMSV
ncbi:hypothetical protein GDO81_026401 [Engystomops pustulosus]|uniref:Uncharacterized protein n=1 Tax=Engystomops pustulosus TaxID=76066 RepID=A0AAV6YNQ0_ENGPU|nr:hypothetical protein GDO81_026401 [Engystomops pustulosus]